ncbi:hypothetical protein V6N13_042590 [Hibiscus sabdariffa]|uniref:Plant heme peroxidase family profile domain-containing protein n=1 Tax=Hibiscus sabdariffa TaxID=183260 RepID=A0ABR2G599_9ROSI
MATGQKLLPFLFLQLILIRMVSNLSNAEGLSLRLHFHDRFVRGCHSSMLLNSTKTNQAERDAIPNLSSMRLKMKSKRNAPVWFPVPMSLP